MGSPADGSLSEVRGPLCGQKACPPAHAEDGPHADISEAPHKQAEPGAQGLSLSVERTADYKTEPGLVCGHQLHPDEAWFPLSRGGNGLVQQEGVELAAFKYA